MTEMGCCCVAPTVEMAVTVIFRVGPWLFESEEACAAGSCRHRDGCPGHGIYSDVLVVPGVEVTTTCWSMVVLPMLVVKMTAVIIA